MAKYEDTIEEPVTMIARGEPRLTVIQRCYAWRSTPVRDRRDSRNHGNDYRPDTEPHLQSVSQRSEPEGL